MELKERTVIVTGSGSGVGQAIAIECARQGANVTCCARRKNKIDETVAIIEKEGGKAIAVQTDITIQDQVEKMVAETVGKFGGIDVLINNAGSFQSLGGVWEVNPDEWWHDVTVNLRGPMLCCHAVLPHMMKRDEGIIININGGGSSSPLTGGSGYGCSKTGLMRLTDGIAAEMERTGSAVMAFGMGPSLVRTEMTEFQSESEQGRKWIPSTKECLDAGQVRPPEDCAKGIVELLRIACPELNGRIFNAVMDFDEVSRRTPEIKNDDLYVIRMRS